MLRRPGEPVYPPIPRGDGLGRGFQFLWSVPQAAANTFSIGAVIRSDRVLAQTSSLLNDSIDEQDEPFFTTVVFHLPSFVHGAPGKADLARGPGRLVMAELEASPGRGSPGR